MLVFTKPAMMSEAARSSGSQITLDEAAFVHDRLRAYRKLLESSKVLTIREAQLQTLEQLTHTPDEYMTRLNQVEEARKQYLRDASDYYILRNDMIMNERYIVRRMVYQGEDKMKKETR